MRTQHDSYTSYMGYYFQTTVIFLVGRNEFVTH
jgi:hypothetical protein